MRQYSGINQDIEQNPFVKWLYNSLAPQLPLNPSYLQRNYVRQGRLTTIVLLSLTLIVSLLMPATLFIPNHLVSFIVGIVIVCCLFAIYLNRSGHTLAASALIVVFAEVALLLTIFTTRPFDTLNLPLYDLLCMTEILAVVLFPPSIVFAFLLLNIGAIVISVHFQPHTQALTLLMHSQYYNILVRPIALQIIASVVLWIVVVFMRLSIERANRAEMITELERQVVEQKEESENLLIRLEKDIQHIVYWVTGTTNGARALVKPVPSERILWPIIGNIANLHMRLERAKATDIELAQLKRAIQQYANYLNQQQKMDVSFHPTHTELDALLIALHTQRPTLSPPRHS